MKQAVKTKQDILSFLQQNGLQLEKYGVNKIGLFGSFVYNKQKETSDIDLLVEFKPHKKTYDNFINLSFFLEDLFHRKVELVTVESLSPYIKPHILKEVEYATFIS